MTSLSVSVDTIDDTISEGIEQFLASLLNSANGLEIGDRATTTVDINDSDDSKICIN